MQYIINELNSDEVCSALDLCKVQTKQVECTFAYFIPLSITIAAALARAGWGGWGGNDGDGDGGWDVGGSILAFTPRTPSTAGPGSCTDSVPYHTVFVSLALQVSAVARLVAARQALSKARSSNSTECTICEDVIQSLDTVLTNPSEQKEIIDELSNVVCKPLGPFKDDCTFDVAVSFFLTGRRARWD